MTIRAALIMLLGWPAMFAVALLVVSASIVLGLTLAIASRCMDRLEALAWPEPVPGWP